MKIVCLTKLYINVEYLEIYSTDDDFNLILDDEESIYVCDWNFPEHVIGKYPKKHFISIAEYRDKRINEILE